MKHPLPLALLLGAVAALAPWGCTAKTPPPGDGNGAGAGTLPAAVILTGKPEAQPLLAVRERAQVGDEIAFEARIGGSADPFVPNRAVIRVIDPTLKSCDQLPGDTCPQPWDYCCETPETRVAHSATVMFVDESGKPLPFSIEGDHGIAALKTVRIVGTVFSKSDANFVVHASGIWVGS